MKDLERFITGFKHFRKEYFGKEEGIFETLQHGQSPRTMLIGCSDSRVDPAILTRCGPGEIFTVRNVANLVPPFQDDQGLHGVSAALEYAVLVLQVRHIIILGHSSCGGIGALLAHDTGKHYKFISDWIAIAEPVRLKITEELHKKPAHLRRRAAEEASILLSLENLLTFPFVTEAVDSGTLHLHGWYFDMAEGKHLSYSPENGRFEVLE